MAKLTSNTFIEKAQYVHGDKYDYSQSEYRNVDTKICIICKKHGPFLQIPYNHMNGAGCHTCHFEKLSILHSKGLDDFIKQASQIQKENFDYSKVNYKNRKTAVEIICPNKHSFFQRPEVHLLGFGCPICSKLKKLTKDKFIEKANALHNFIYDYSLVEYVNSRTKVKIICQTDDHGIFEQSANSHLQGKGCPKCIFKGQTLTEKWLKAYLPDIRMATQKILNIDGKKIVVDFYFEHKQKYVLEYNGPQHYEITKFNGISASTAETLFARQMQRDYLLKAFCMKNNIQLIELDSRIYNTKTLNDCIKQDIYKIAQSIMGDK